MGRLIWDEPDPNPTMTINDYLGTFLVSPSASVCFCGLILFGANLFHPVNYFAVEGFLNGNVCHRCGWCSTVPMFLAWRKPNDIARMDFFN